jgi:hypothetical protein
MKPVDCRWDVESVSLDPIIDDDGGRVLVHAALDIHSGKDGVASALQPPPPVVA